MKSLLILITCASVMQSASAAEAAPAISAKDLAAKLSALQQDGSSYVRLKLNSKPAAGAPKISLQLQIKQRRSRNSTELVYQVLWPKERAGEAVLLRQSGNQPATGSLFIPPNTVRPLTQAQMKDSLFGSDISYADALENFYAWENQTITGTEMIGRVNCQILESKPGKGQRSGYSGVRSWVDSRRLVPLRIEKFLSSGTLARRIDTADVATDDIGRSVPATLTVSSPQTGSSTVLDGSKLKHGVTLTDREFTPDGIREITTPPASAN